MGVKTGVYPSQATRAHCLKSVLKQHLLVETALINKSDALTSSLIAFIAPIFIVYQSLERRYPLSGILSTLYLRRKTEGMLNAIQQGILTASTKGRLEQLEAQREELKTGIMQSELQKPRYTKEQIISWIGRFKYGDADDPEYQKQIIDVFINSIFVFDDSLVFTYNFRDGTETITLKEVEEAFGSDLTHVVPP